MCYFAMPFFKALQRYAFLRTQPNKLHKNGQNVHTSPFLCNVFFCKEQKDGKEK